MRPPSSSVLAVILLGLAACSTGTDASTTAAASRGDAAVWFVGPDANLDPSTTTFTAVVSRLGCNGGVTGEVLAPDIRMDGSEIILTFEVAPKELGDASCPGNEWVPYEVTLPEPLGDRALVDGQCLTGGDAATTAHCEPDATRFDGT